MAAFKPGWKKELKEKKEKEAKVVLEVKTESTKIEEPIFKSFYIDKDKGKWRVVIADIQGDKVLSRQIKECDNKGMSLETFKIAFAKMYYFGR